jgi:hypothetical protein
MLYFFGIAFILGLNAQSSDKSYNDWLNSPKYNAHHEVNDNHTPNKNGHDNNPKPIAIAALPNITCPKCKSNLAIALKEIEPREKAYWTKIHKQEEEYEKKLEEKRKIDNKVEKLRQQEYKKVDRHNNTNHNGRK